MTRYSDDEHDDDVGGNNKRNSSSCCNAAPSSHEQPFRNCDGLLASRCTVDCALRGSGDGADTCCVPCSYKIGCFDVALDTELCRLVPNQRPETCPRAANGAAAATGKQWQRLGGADALGYTNEKNLNVLTVGDGDFSFSLAVARLILSQAETGSRPPSSLLIATSYETEDTLRQCYPSVTETIQELRRLGAVVLFEIDATDDFRNVLVPSVRSHLSASRSTPTPFAEELSGTDNETHLFFDRIVWNFPCTAIAKGQDGQNKEMDRNKDLVRRFVANAAPYLAPSEESFSGERRGRRRPAGQIHINHKTKPPFNQWRIEDVAVKGLTKGTGNDNGGDTRSTRRTKVRYLYRVVLDRCLLPPYTPRKALDRKSFPVHDACTYVFERVDEVDDEYDDGDKRLRTDDADRPPQPAGLLPVTTNVIRTIRTNLLNLRTSQKEVTHMRKKGRKKY